MWRSNTHTRHPTSDPSHPTCTHRGPMQKPPSLTKQFKPRGVQLSLDETEPISRQHESRSNRMQLSSQNYLYNNHPSSNSELERIATGCIVRPPSKPSRPHLMQHQVNSENCNVLQDDLHPNYNGNHSIEDDICVDENEPNAGNKFVLLCF